MSWVMPVVVSMTMIAGIGVIVLLLVMLLEWIRLGQKLWYLKCVKWVAARLPGTWKNQFLIVRLLDQTNNVLYSLALHHENHHLMAYPMGMYLWEKVPLHPRGVVLSTLSQLVAWDHVDPDLHIQQLLSYPGYMSIDSWLTYHPTDKLNRKYDILSRVA